MISYIHKLATRLALKAIPQHADWGVKEEEVREAVSRNLRVMLLIPVMISLLAFVNPLFITLSAASIYPMLKLAALQAANTVFKDKLKAEKYSPLIIDELRLAYRATNSVERAIYFVAEGEYPGVSPKLREILRRAEGGEDLSKLLLKYALLEAPPSLREFIPRFLRRPSQARPPPSLQRRLWEVHLEEVRKLRLNILLFSAFSFLLPIPVVLLLLLAGVVRYLPLLTPVYVTATALMAKLMVVSKPAPLG